MEPNTGDSLQAQQETFDWSSLNKEDLEELQRLLDTHTFSAVELDSGKLRPSYEEFFEGVSRSWFPPPGPEGHTHGIADNELSMLEPNGLIDSSSPSTSILSDRIPGETSSWNHSFDDAPAFSTFAMPNSVNGSLGTSSVISALRFDDISSSSSSVSDIPTPFVPTPAASTFGSPDLTPYHLGAESLARLSRAPSSSPVEQFVGDPDAIPGGKRQKRTRSTTEVDPEDEFDSTFTLEQELYLSDVAQRLSQNLVVSVSASLSGSFAVSTSKIRSKKGKKHIPRPWNAFILWKSAHTPQLMVEFTRRFPTGPFDPKTTGRVYGEIWNRIPEDSEEKRRWFSKAKQGKDLHRLQYPDYRFKPVHRAKHRTPSHGAKFHEILEGEIPSAEYV